MVVGFHGTATGLGSGARLMYERLRSAGIQAERANVSRFAGLEDFAAGPLWPVSAKRGGIAIFHDNPNMTSLVMAAIGRARLRQRRLAGLWAWELDKIPPAWQKTICAVDEVWTQSKFIAGAFKKAAPSKPVYIVPPPLDVDKVPTVPRQDPLPQFKGRPMVFFSYDVRSIHARKNPEAVIETFRRATKGMAEPVLVLKINNGHVWPKARLRLEAAMAGAANIYLMQEKLSPAAMQDLMARADIILSLHRSEGYGLLMAEGMAAGKAVIATGFSGNVDFMAPDCCVLVNYKLVPIEDPQRFYDKYGAKWAEADIEHAEAALKRLLSDPAERLRLGQAARAHIRNLNTPQNWLKHLPESFWQSLDNPPSS